MDFILIAPPTEYVVNNKVDTRHMPFGALYLAESLQRYGYSCVILDNSVESIIQDIDKLSNEKTIAYGISTLSGFQLENALKIAEYIKKKNDSKPIIWGGAHINAVPAQTLESNLVDYIVVGEGENTLIELLDAIKNNKDLLN